MNIIYSPFMEKRILDICRRKGRGLKQAGQDRDVFARRPQIQEKMTAQIAEALEENLHPQGVIVMLEAEHTCMTMRGIKKPGSKTVTLVTTGVFQDNYELQNRFLSMVRQGLSGEKRAGEERAGAGLAGMKDAMERVNRIWFHPFYQECLRKIRAHEAEREFCRHTPEHFLDVARLTYILALEADCLPSQPLERAAVGNGSTRRDCSTISAAGGSMKRESPMSRPARRLRKGFFRTAAFPGRSRRRF